MKDIVDCDALTKSQPGAGVDFLGCSQELSGADSRRELREWDGSTRPAASAAPFAQFAKFAANVSRLWTNEDALAAEAAVTRAGGRA